MRKKKQSNPYRVYATYFPDGRYYIGYSNKSPKLFEKYFGSSKEIKESKEELCKEVIAEFTTKSHAKMQEFLLQWQYRHDEMCINDMIHLRMRLTYLKNFEPIEWKPKGTTYYPRP